MAPSLGDNNDQEIRTRTDYEAARPPTGVAYPTGYEGSSREALRSTYESRQRGSGGSGLGFPKPGGIPAPTTRDANFTKWSTNSEVSRPSDRGYPTGFEGGEREDIRRPVEESLRTAGSGGGLHFGGIVGADTQSAGEEIGVAKGNA